MRELTKDWIYILLLGAVTFMYFFVDGLSDAVKGAVTFAVFVIMVLIKFAVKNKEDKKSNV